MGVGKVIMGVLSIVFGCMSMLQSCSVGVLNEIAGSGNDGTMGVVMAILMIVGGVLEVMTKTVHNKENRNLLCIVFFIAALAGITGLTKDFMDLFIWAIWCFINIGFSEFEYTKNNRR